MKVPKLRRAKSMPVRRGMKAWVDMKREISQPKEPFEIKKLYRQNTAGPIDMRGKFNGGYRDDNHYRTLTQDAIKAEKEMFYPSDNEEPEKKIVSMPFFRRRKSVPVRLKFDQKKLDQVLIGICTVWDDSQFENQLPKLKALLSAKADINTTKGSGLFSESLIARMSSDRHPKLREALINLADPPSLEPDSGESLLTMACGKASVSTVELLLNKNCEPNRIEVKGMTPLIQLFLFADEETYEPALKCLKLLLNHEGKDAMSLKKQWAKKCMNVCPGILQEEYWIVVFDFCIPNLNVLPEFTNFIGSQDALKCLNHYKKSQEFQNDAKALIGHLFVDARYQQEKYWPKSREKYIKMFNHNWR